MIIRPQNRLALLYILQGSFFHRLWKPLLLLFLFSVAVSYHQRHILEYQIPLNATVFTLLGIALAIFHGFCNTAAYDRFWEGRKQWGALIWQTRALAYKVTTLPHIPENTRREMVSLIITFSHCLRHQLRGESAEANIRRTAPEVYQAELLASPYPALMTNQLLARLNAQLLRDGHIGSIEWQSIDDNLEEIALIQAACERISNTPIPFAYFVMMHRTVYGYCFLLPFGLINSIGWVTPFMVTFVGYTFMALSEIVDEISEPFGTAENDLALTAMCQTIETQLSLLGGLNLPPSEEHAKRGTYIVQ